MDDRYKDVSISKVNKLSNNNIPKQNIYWACKDDEAWKYLTKLDLELDSKIETNITDYFTVTVYLTKTEEPNILEKRGFTFSKTNRHSISEDIGNQCAESTNGAFTYVVCEYSTSVVLKELIDKKSNEKTDEKTTKQKEPKETNYEIYGYYPVEIKPKFDEVNINYNILTQKKIFTNRGERFTKLQLTDERFRGNHTENLTGYTAQIKVTDVQYPRTYTIVKHTDDTIVFVIQTGIFDLTRYVENEDKKRIICGLESELIKKMRYRITRHRVNYYSLGCTAMNPVIAAIGFV
jgi:hypothetical protein